MKSQYIEVLADQCPSLCNVCVVMKREDRTMEIDFTVKRGMISGRVEKVYMKTNVILSFAA